MAFFGQSVLKVLTAIFVMCAFSVTACADDYLDMLEAEAEDVELDQSSQLKDKEQINRNSTDGITKTDWIWEGDLVGDRLPANLAQDEFATLLKHNFYGTFVFYRKLNSVDQRTVYYHYTKSSPANLDPIRDDILNHLKK